MRMPLNSGPGIRACVTNLVISIYIGIVKELSAAIVEDEVVLSRPIVKDKVDLSRPIHLKN